MFTPEPAVESVLIINFVFRGASTAAWALKGYFGNRRRLFCHTKNLCERSAVLETLQTRTVGAEQLLGCNPSVLEIKRVKRSSWLQHTLPQNLFNRVGQVLIGREMGGGLRSTIKLPRMLAIPMDRTSHQSDLKATARCEATGNRPGLSLLCAQVPSPLSHPLQSLLLRATHLLIRGTCSKLVRCSKLLAAMPRGSEPWALVRWVGPFRGRSTITRGFSAVASIPSGRVAFVPQAGQHRAGCSPRVLLPSEQ